MPTESAVAAEPAFSTIIIIIIIVVVVSRSTRSISCTSNGGGVADEDLLLRESGRHHRDNRDAGRRTIASDEAETEATSCRNNSLKATTTPWVWLYGCRYCQ